jgi:hypothetical protein
MYFVPKFSKQRAKVYLVIRAELGEAVNFAHFAPRDSEGAFYLTACFLLHGQNKPQLLR